jgi:hypothetical protein
LVVLESYAREVLNRLTADDSHANKVKRVIVDVLRGESPTLGMIASRVNMSIRNLQLKLTEEGTTYSALLAKGRRELTLATSGSAYLFPPHSSDGAKIAGPRVSCQSSVFDDRHIQGDSISG